MKISLELYKLEIEIVLAYQPHTTQLYIVSRRESKPCMFLNIYSAYNVFPVLQLNFIEYVKTYDVHYSRAYMTWSSYISLCSFLPRLKTAEMGAH